MVFVMVISIDCRVVMRDSLLMTAMVVALAFLMAMGMAPCFVHGIVVRIIRLLAATRKLVVSFGICGHLICIIADF